MHRPNWNHTKIIDHNFMDAPAILNYDALSRETDSISVISKDYTEMSSVIEHLTVSRRLHICGDWIEFGWHIVDLTRTDETTSTGTQARVRAVLQKWRDDREGR